ncbi:MAG TPA: IS4 family transposase [Polyangiaceae bacterium]|jgi:hypothetical protein|nr:IS4 family transposase [Polyangiaceae bacterium]
MKLVDWAFEEFGDADLGDARRSRRVVALAASMALKPGGRVTAVVTHSAEREAAFRLLRNPAVDEAELARSSHLATLARLGNDKHFLVAVDQTGLTVTDTGATKGFGRTGSKPHGQLRGLQVMTAMAVREDGSCLGLCAQKWWCRVESKAPNWNDDRRPLSKRESWLWHSVIDQTELALDEGGHTNRAWYQLDRGGDSYHVLRKARDEGLLITVRSAYDRALVSDGQSMRTKVSSSKVLGGFQHFLKPSAARRAGHSACRARKLVVRALPVRLRLTEYRPNFQKTEMDLWVVHVRESSPPRNAERLEWFLQTTYPVKSKYDALRVARAYCLRWRIEEFHKTWKSGACQMETSQLRSPQTFKRWATLHAAVAARIERFKHTARNAPSTPALQVASRWEIDAAILLTTRCRFKPGDELNTAEFVLLVANLGGYTGKSSGGPPGSIVIKRGFDQVLAAGRALEAASKLNICD